jgi:hypothetical protein
MLVHMCDSAEFNFKKLVCHHYTLELKGKKLTFGYERPTLVWNLPFRQLEDERSSGRGWTTAAPANFECSWASGTSATSVGSCGFKRATVCYYITSQCTWSHPSKLNVIRFVKTMMSRDL